MPGASRVYVAARGALLDALEALRDHLDALVLVGAQAIYFHTGEADVAIATQTKDGDLVVDPSLLGSDPLLEDAMKRAGFVLNLETRQPGEWISREGVPVDLLVPEGLGGPGRRAARIPPHSKEAARKVTGLEPAVLDNEWRVIDSFDGRDRRQYDIRVAGPGALLVAKLHKLGERDERSTHRLADKDAHDIYRLLRAVPTEVFVEKIDLFGNDPLTRAVTGTAVEFLERLFRSPESLGAVMAGRAEELVGEPAVTATAAASLARDVLDRLTN